MIRILFLRCSADKWCSHSHTGRSRLDRPILANLRVELGRYVSVHLSRHILGLVSSTAREGNGLIAFTSFIAQRS
jgi:hypothetical protein